MELFHWIDKHMHPDVVNSVDFMYDEMESQSAYSLPFLYQPFNAALRSHWRDRGWMFDFLYTTGCENGRVLDFGPGDGWPSLIIASSVREVLGVDGSERRVRVCRKNARKLGIKNARFIRVPPGRRLPFDENSFDAVVAASSVEQTPDPKATIGEFFRVLKPGGRARIVYEALSSYAGGKERELFFDSDGDGNCVLAIYNRDSVGERALMYKIRCNVECRSVFKIFIGERGSPEDITFDALSVEKLSRLLRYAGRIEKCVLTHPSGNTFARWMQSAGFVGVYASQSGAGAAAALYDKIPPGERPSTVEGVDELVRPAVKRAVEIRDLFDHDLPITAAKEESIT